VDRVRFSNLDALLNELEIRAEASEAPRALIGRLVLTPDADAEEDLRSSLE